ncbi:MerR family transcriptional regulator [Catelliglobosispora koreensis]|uniref:MerR family transcriptional regulator n=1 Tax=Catelliglobosispora koreensis TaxID=129052 RepID=UPI0004763CA2|nr:MerR family transcriptional regulator [Catelliglobosispora koreensis]
MAQLMRISELAQAAGVSKRTVDFYTNLGLIQPAQRTESGYRLYDPNMVDVIATIRQLEASGMALDDIGKDLTTATAADLAEIVSKLNTDLEALRTLAESAGSNAHGMATSLAVRAHNLIVMATELLIAMPDV